jgi:hypothetical protein
MHSSGVQLQESHCPYHVEEHRDRQDDAAVDGGRNCLESRYSHAQSTNLKEAQVSAKKENENRKKCQNTRSHMHRALDSCFQLVRHHGSLSAMEIVMLISWLHCHRYQHVVNTNSSQQALAWDAQPRSGRSRVSEFMNFAKDTGHHDFLPFLVQLYSQHGASAQRLVKQLEVVALWHCYLPMLTSYDVSFRR